MVTSYTIDRGRQLEFDRTDTGRATVEIADVDGILDPTNPTGPYYGQIEPLLQAVIQVRNPVDGVWYPRFRGWIDELDYSFDPSQQVNRLTVSMVDIFEMLAAVEMMPGQFGIPPLTVSSADSADQVFFQENFVQLRITQILENALNPPGALTIRTTGSSSPATSASGRPSTPPASPPSPPSRRRLMRSSPVSRTCSAIGSAACVSTAASRS